MILTTDDYKLWTGQTVSMTMADWERVSDVANSRLLSFLCLESTPTNEDGNTPDGYQELLANFICAVQKFKGNADSTVEEKRVRNFTIRFSGASAANAYAQIASQYQQTIDEYSDCGSGVVVEKSTRLCCGRF